jgi:EAL and modified HD-GYP domain-containing signal transduction protein
VCEAGYEPLVELADIIKVDFRMTSEPTQSEFSSLYGGRGIKMLAEKVETQEEFLRALEMGYDYFQGYFFSKPAIIIGRQVPGFKLNYLRIIKEINNPQLDFDRIEEIIKYEASLVHKLLRYINSASFGLRRQINSIRHALSLLGERELRKWVALAALTGLAGDKPQQLVVNAVIRGRFCELISVDLGLLQRQSELFLTGMFSLLDAILDMPMEEVVAEVQLTDDVRDTLLGRTPATRGLKESLELARAYEVADWAAIERIAESLNLRPGTVAETYVDSVEWADGVFKG